MSAVVTVDTLSLLSLPHLSFTCTNLSTLELTVHEKICSLLTKCGRKYIFKAGGVIPVHLTRGRRVAKPLHARSEASPAYGQFFSHAFRLTSNETRVAARGLQTFVRIKNISGHVPTLKPYSLYFYPVQFSVPSLFVSTLF